MNRTHRRTRVRLLAGLAGALSVTVLAVAGCSSSSSSSSSAAAASTNSSSAKVPLVVYAAEGYDSAETKAFTKATGIPTKLDDNSTGPLLTQIEASKNNPNWGLLWVDGPTAFAALDTQDLLVKGFEPSVSWNALGTASLPTDKSYVPTGITLVAAVVYNKAKVKNPPTTFQALESATWKGQVGMDDPSQSGPTYPFVADKNLGIEYLKPATLLPSVIGIDAKAPAAEQQEAEKFVDFVLSAAGQKVMQSGDPTGDSLYYPVLQGVNPLPALPPLPSGVTQTINPYTWGPQEGTINEWFDANITR
jgi:iron(III) transport system substrate-binding protein